MVKTFITQLTGEAPAASADPSVETAQDLAGNVVEFDTSGRAVNTGLMTVLQRGFKVDTSVIKKGSDSTRAHIEGGVCKITFIASDGGVSMVTIAKDGSPQARGDVIC